MNPGQTFRKRLFVTLASAALLAPSSTALAAGTTLSPFSPGVPVAPVTSTAAPTPTVITNSSTNGSGSSSLSSSSVLVIAIGAVVILGGISLFIWRDARRRAPVPVRGADPDGRGRPSSKPRAKPRKLSAAERRRRKRGRAPRR